MALIVLPHKAIVRYLRLDLYSHAVMCWPALNPKLAIVQSFEQLNPRAVAVVVDPIQSVKGKVVIDAFR